MMAISKLQILLLERYMAYWIWNEEFQWKLRESAPSVITVYDIYVPVENCLQCSFFAGNKLYTVLHKELNVSMETNIYYITEYSIYYMPDKK